MACNFLGDEWFVDSLKRPIIRSRSPWFVEGQVAGYAKEFDKIRFTTIRVSTLRNVKRSVVCFHFYKSCLFLFCLAAAAKLNACLDSISFYATNRTWNHQQETNLPTHYAVKQHIVLSGNTATHCAVRQHAVLSGNTLCCQALFVIFFVLQWLQKISSWFLIQVVRTLEMKLRFVNFIKKITAQESFHNNIVRLTANRWLHFVCIT